MEWVPGDLVRVIEDSVEHMPCDKPAADRPEDEIVHFPGVESAFSRVTDGEAGAEVDAERDQHSKRME